MKIRTKGKLNGENQKQWEIRSKGKLEAMGNQKQRKIRSKGKLEAKEN